jgi:hypothetical protein
MPTKYCLAILFLSSSASAADRPTLSSTNPTAFDMDQIIASEDSLRARVSTLT